MVLNHLELFCNVINMFFFKIKTFILGIIMQLKISAGRLTLQVNKFKVSKFKEKKT